MLRRRKETYEAHKETLLNVFGSDAECKKVFTSEMVSDQEDEEDEQGTLARARKAPHYRQQRVSLM